MGLEIIAGAAESLQSYAAVSIAFEVTEVIDIGALQTGTSRALKTRPISTPYTKDYDALPGNHPSQWPRQFPVADWTILAAHDAGRQVGGAILVPEAEWVRDAMSMLLWDLRVAPEFRRRGIGHALLAKVEAVALSRGRQNLYVETQDVNVGACRFYAHHGFLPDRIARGVYPGLPDETRVLWKKRLQ